jgi:hypothetical protein
VGGATVLRPWAERLLDVLRPRPGERILDASADGGLLHRRLTRAVGPGGVVVTHGAGSGWLVSGPPIDAAASLLSLQFAVEPAALLAELLEAVEERNGRVAVLVQLAEGSPHEAAVVEVLGDALARPATLSAPEIDSLLERVRPGAAPLRAERLRDVIRFDGIDQLWAALVAERCRIPPELDARRRSVLEASLDRWIAADGTLRIAAEAVALTAVAIGRG